MHEQILGDYRILKQIGEGALGNALLAEHRFIKKTYVLKVLPYELCHDRGFIERFEKEVAKLALLDHPHIVKIHNVSFSEGVYFLVTDCIRETSGETKNLAQFMAARKERLNEEDLLSVMSQIADALDYAHSHGSVAHSSLKLNNILIGKEKPYLSVFIADFGLAHIISPAKVAMRCFKAMADTLEVLPADNGKEERYVPTAIDGEKLSKLSQSFLQGYSFLAPEQKRCEESGIAADIYAFGILTYFLISGSFPEGVFKMPSVIASEYQHDWDRLITECLQSNPAHRPSRLLPLLEKKAVQSFSAQQKPFHTSSQSIRESPLSSKLSSMESSSNELLTTNKVFNHETNSETFDDSVLQPTILHDSLLLEKEKTQEKEHAAPIDQLKTAPMRPLVPQHIEKEESALKPIILRTADKIPVPISESTSGRTSGILGQELSKLSTNSSSLSEENPKTSQSWGSQSSALSAPAATATVPDNKESGLDSAENYAQQLNSMLNRDPVITQYQPEKKESRDTEPLQTEMVVIRGGQFMRGSNSGNRDEMPFHKVQLQSFAIDIHPVTNEQFVRFLEYMGGEKDKNYNDLIRLKDSRLARTAGKLSIEPGYAKHPVVGVTWYGAIAYAKWAGKRLPTEAEWEIAARGGLENAIYSTGDHIEKSQANFFSSDTTPVLSYAPNGYGLFDMVGNVYEWCQDWYGYNYYETSIHEPNNPRGPLQGVYRVLRGGCWKSLQDDMRCSHRHRNNPGTVNSTYGFRCAADVQ